MSSLPINNIVHKLTSKNLSILYYPSEDRILNDLITNLECNFIIRAPYSDIKPNTIITSLLHIHEYDFILTHHIDNEIMQTSHSLHIPIVYWPTFIVDTNKINNTNKNIGYVIENVLGKRKETVNKNICLIDYIVPYAVNINKNTDRVPIFIRHNNIDSGDIVRALTSQYPNLSVVDDNKLNNVSMLEVMDRCSIMIDFRPYSSTKIAYCSRYGVPYITLNNETNLGYKSLYSNVVLINLDSSMLNSISTYLNSSLPNNSTQNDDVEILYKYFTATKLTGFIL